MYSQPVDVNVRILNAGAWSRTSEKIAVSLPAELEDLVPSIEEFYKRKHNGRKLQWNNLMSNGEWEGDWSNEYFISKDQVLHCTALWVSLD